MKKFVCICVGFVLTVVLAVVMFSNNQEKEQENGYLRIHVRANSNSEEDQRIKYDVKEAVVNFLTPLIAEGTTFTDAYKILKNNLKQIEAVADEVLAKAGYKYSSSARLKDEYFPTRSYGGVTLENGYYDALILNLGEGAGNNWWCVVYPPLCFIGAEGNAVENIRYKSKLVEIIQNFFA